MYFMTTLDGGEEISAIDGPSTVEIDGADDVIQRMSGEKTDTYKGQCGIVD